MVILTAPKPYESKTVASNDGTTIGYRQLGRGPGLVLIHGGMMAAQSFMKLASALSDDFTVFIPDRRGRGSSGPFGRNYGLCKEVEDVAAIIDRTGAHCVFGLSSGAIIALESALQLPVIRKLALYEPPLSINGSHPAAWLPRYDSEIAAGNLPAAMVTVSKGVPVSPVFSRLPRLIGTMLMRLAIPAEAKQTKNDDVSLAALIPTMHGDAQVVIDAADKLNSYRDVKSHVLLIGGGRSPHSLKIALNALAAMLPSVQRMEIVGVGHMAADNGGQPERVAQELLRFFTTVDAGDDRN
jgi:pimeloyl-ACP methyl ester carboxylesterase